MSDTKLAASGKTKSLSAFMTKAVFGCFILLTVFIALSKIGYLFELVPAVLAIAGIIAIALLCIIAVVNRKVLLKYVWKVMAWLENRLTAKKAIVILIVLSLGSKLASIAVLGIDSLIHPDINTYVVTAQELLTHGSVETYGTYCWNFSHMYWYAFFLMPAVGLFGANATALSIYLSLVSTATIVLLFDTTRKYLSTAAAFVIFMLFTLLPGQILLPTFVTHEHAMLFFLSATVWLIFKVIPGVKKENKVLRIALYALSCITMFWATQMNAAALVAVIALCIVYVISGLKERSIRVMGAAAMKCIALILVILIGGNLCSAYQASHSRLGENTIEANKLVRILYVGSNVETTGQWSLEDVESFDKYSAGSSEEEIDAYRKELLADRYDYLFQNPGKFAELLTNKFSTVWSCFGYSISFANETVKESVRGVYNRILFKPLTCLEYGVSVVLLLMFIFSLGKVCKKEMPMFFVFIQLFMLGDTLMLLLTECANKYTIALQPFYVIIFLGSYLLSQGDQFCGKEKEL